MRRYFVRGLLVLLPGVITVYLLVFGLSTIDKVLGSVIKKLFGYHIPGAGSILTILLILAAGIFTTNVIGKRIFQWGERMLLRIPILKNVYQGAEQVVRTFSNSADTQNFQRVVLLEYPRDGVYALGFVTNENIPEFDQTLQESSITVFIPTTPNPTSGVCVVVPAKNCIPLEISVESAFKTIISAGIIGPSKKNGNS